MDLIALRLLRDRRHPKTGVWGSQRFPFWRKAADAVEAKEFSHLSLRSHINVSAVAQALLRVPCELCTECANSGHRQECLCHHLTAGGRRASAALRFEGL